MTALARRFSLSLLGGMDDSAPPIPDDLAAYQAMIREQARTIDARDHTIESHALIGRNYAELRGGSLLFKRN